MPKGRVVKRKRRAPKRKTATQLKKILDKWTSIYIRLRDSDKDGIGKCITCNKKAYWKKMQNGHFMSRRFHSIRWHPKNQNLQCQYCNVICSGRQFLHGKALDQKWGEGTAEEMEAKSREIVKISTADYREMILKTIEDIKELVKTKEMTNETIEDYNFKFPKI